jgi:hypothetical protein
MTAIEKAVKTVSDLRDFYRRIPKIGRQETKTNGEQNELVQRTPQTRRR